jgi:hypothetical protein
MMNWRQLRNYLKGKVVLVGLTFIDQEGKIIERYQTHGTIAKLTIDGFFKIIREDNSVFRIPYLKETIKRAKEGKYREVSTGETVENPDLIMTWKVKNSDNTDLEEIKKHGYLPVFDYDHSNRNSQTRENDEE